jgi:hypothetical protein
MEISEQELRALVRETIARSGRTPPPAPAAESRSTHDSHRRFALPQGADGDGACLIEPSVGCTHCGFCQSLGH